MHTPILRHFLFAQQTGQALPWKFLRHAFVHTTYPLGYVKNLTFGTLGQRKRRG